MATDLTQLETLTLPLIYKRGDKMWRIGFETPIESVVVNPVTAFKDVYETAKQGTSSGNAAENL